MAQDLWALFVREIPADSIIIQGWFRYLGHCGSGEIPILLYCNIVSLQLQKAAMANSASNNSLPACDSNSSSNRNSVISDTYEVPQNGDVENEEENGENDIVTINIKQNSENEISVLSQQNNNSKTATTNNKGKIWVYTVLSDKVYQ